MLNCIGSSTRNTRSNIPECKQIPVPFVEPKFKENPCTQTRSTTPKQTESTAFELKSSQIPHWSFKLMQLFQQQTQEEGPSLKSHTWIKIEIYTRIKIKI